MDITEEWVRARGCACRVLACMELEVVLQLRPRSLARRRSLIPLVLGPTFFPTYDMVDV